MLRPKLRHCNGKAINKYTYIKYSFKNFYLKTNTFALLYW